MTLERILQAAVNSLAQGKRNAHCADSNETAMRRAQSELECFDYASEYGEPGYDNPRRGIVFANWNPFPRGLDDVLERAGYSVEWSDEWIVSETGKAYRSSPDSYGWKPYYVLTDDGDVIGGDEIESGDQLEWYVNEYLLNNPRRANVFKIDLAALGFKRFNGEFETGFHPGQNDDPKQVCAHIRRDLPDHDIVFSLDSVGQFDQKWTAWTRPSSNSSHMATVNSQ
jgi:hypothetical protein